MGVGATTAREVVYYVIKFNSVSSPSTVDRGGSGVGGGGGGGE